MLGHLPIDLFCFYTDQGSRETRSDREYWAQHGENARTTEVSFVVTAREILLITDSVTVYHYYRFSATV